ncbi:MAG: flavodoxin [Phocaeicola sp.]
MKLRTLLFALVALFSMGATAQSKKLVTYFSVPETGGVDTSTGASRIVTDGKLQGATEYVAHIIAEATGADLFEIKTTHTYPGDHKELIEYAKKEAENKTYPKIASKIENLADYDVVFVGYPNWWYDMPMVIYTLLREYDFSGKTIVPFCTHGGSGYSQSVETIQKLEKDAQVIRMPAISRTSVANSRKGIENWLQKQGLAK